MTDEKLQKEVLDLIRNSDYQSIERAEKLLESHLELNPDDADGWGRLAILETLTPIEDYERASKYLKSALKNNEKNPQLIILISFFTGWYLGGMDKSLISKLFEIKKTSDLRTSSTISYLLAWHFKAADSTKFELLLNESINECSEHVKNYIDLGNYYLNHNKKAIGKEMLLKGLANVKLIYKESDTVYDRIDVKRFINERINGIYMTEGNYKSIQELL